jgi:hypothetical protein
VTFGARVVRHVRAGHERPGRRPARDPRILRSADLYDQDHQQGTALLASDR